MHENRYAWDNVFRTKGRVFTRPHENMPAIASFLKARLATRILDLGSGTGRHLVYFARRGFKVYGIDNSSAGIKLARQWLRAEGLRAWLFCQDIRRRLPFPTRWFDAVIAVQVIHHGRLADIKRIVREIERVIKLGGLIFVTVPALRNQGLQFKRIEPGTYVPLDGPEKGLPHHYFTPRTLRAMFSHFDIQSLRVDRNKHYCLTGYKK